MTLKYESEILFDLMKRDGDDAPSDVLPYESELKEKYLKQVVGAYPKLQDYHPEWLNYNLYHHLPSDFPVESVANVTSASFNNVVPYAYKSATLKGQTLENLVEAYNVQVTSASSKSLKYIYGSLDASKSYLLQYRVNQLPELTDTSDSGRAFKFEWYNGSATKSHLNVYNKDFVVGKSNTLIIEPYTGDVTRTNFGVYCTNYVSGVLDIDIMIIEYQDGMENWDIPYFTGMQSVKMPVLTTTGKNLFKTFKNNGYHYLGSDTDTNNGTWINDSNFKCLSAKVLPNTQYIQSSKGDYTGNILTFWKDGKFTSKGMRGIITTFTTPSNCDEIRVSCAMENDLQLELGKSSTSYEPYKSNILTVNEEVELRGIGDVRDTLDLISGEIIESIGENVLNGSEAWLFNAPKEQPNHWCFHNEQKLAGEKLLISDRFPQSDIDGDRESIRGGGIFIFVYISKEKVDGNINSFKQWLSQNPIKYQYRKSEKSIKTVDLTVTDQDGNTESIIRPIEGTMHVITSSQTLPPLLDMSVPVEAITQNLMSFANIEVEE